MKNINQEQLKHLVKGACFLGSAGGGTYTSGMNLATHFSDSSYYKTKHVMVANVDELLPNEHGIMVAYIGAPQCMEKIDYPKGIVLAIEELRRRHVTIDYIIPPEIGSISMLAACTAAAQLGIPVVDGDGAGRAVPELSMTTFSMECQSVNPVVLGAQGSSDQPNENNILFMNFADQLDDSCNVETLIRPVLGMDCFGEMAGLAMWLVDGDEIRKIIKSKNTITNCIELGKALNCKDLNAVFEKTREMDYEAEIIAEGTNVSIHTNTGGGFDNGVLHFTAQKDHEKYGICQGAEITVLFKNESLIAWCTSSEAPLIIAPDLISYLITFSDSESQWTYSNGDLQQVDSAILKEATIKLVKLKAPDWLKDVENKMNNVRFSQTKNGVSMNSIQKSYQSVLRSLGYYGKV